MPSRHAATELCALDTDRALEQALAGGPRPLLLVVGAGWCPPYRALASRLKRLARERAAVLDVACVDVDTLAVAAERLVISSVPTLVLLQDGVERGSRSGIAAGQDIDRWLDVLLAPPPR